MDDVFVYLVDFPGGIKESVMPCCDGWTVYLDIKLSEEKRMAALKHALWHIENGDFERDDVQAIEAIAHKRIGG